MNALRIWVAAMAVSLLVGAPARGQLVEDYRFQGQVLDTGGKPLAGVQIVLQNPETGTRLVCTTHADGGFDRRMIPHGVYDARFEKSGYLPRVERFDWSAPTSEPVVKQARVVLESQVERARVELGTKAAKLYEAAYGALAAGDCDTASQKAHELLGLGAGSYEYAVRFVLARCLAMRDSTVAATREYRRVTEIKPDLFEAHFDLAALLEKQGDHPGALAQYATAARLRPEDPEVEYNMGAIEFQQKDFDAARPHLERALELAPDHAQAHKALGFTALQAEQKDLQGAATHLQRYLDLAPQASDAAQVQQILAALAAANAPHK